MVGPSPSRRLQALFGVALLLASARAITHVQVFLSEDEFQATCHRRNIEVDMFVVDQRLLRQTDDIRFHPVSDGAILHSPLYFGSRRTGAPVSMTIKEAGDMIMFRETDTTSSLRLNGAMRIDFSTTVYHEGKHFQRLYAAALVVAENPHTRGEKVFVYNAYGDVMHVVQDIPRPGSGGEHFVGVVSSEPMGAIEYRPTLGDHDVAGVTQVYVGVGDAHLMDGVPPRIAWMFWVAFNVFIVGMLVVDMMVGTKRGGVAAALRWSAVWIALALAFCGAVYAVAGRGPAAVWLTSYLLEKFLSIDNLFVFFSIFSTFETPAQHQHKVLGWGITGAIVLRAVFIFTGVKLVEKFAWIMLLFGAFLVFTGFKTFREAQHELEEAQNSPFGKEDPPASGDGGVSQEHSSALRLIGSIVPLSSGYDAKGAFFVHQADAVGGALLPTAHGGGSGSGKPRGLSGKLMHAAAVGVKGPVQFALKVAGYEGYKATPLFAVLIIIETTDLVFAVDSIPAVLSITTDPFIAYTSNIFAVLGLRALYFALAAAVSQFVYLSHGLGVILVFIGLKMLLVQVGFHVSIEATLAIVLVTLGIAIALSIIWRPKHLSSTATPSSGFQPGDGGGSGSYSHSRSSPPRPMPPGPPRIANGHHIQRRTSNSADQTTAVTVLSVP